LYGYIRDERAPNKSELLYEVIFTERVLEKCMIRDVSLPDSIRKMLGKPATEPDTPRSIAQMLSAQNTTKKILLRKEQPIEKPTLDDDEKPKKKPVEEPTNNKKRKRSEEQQEQSEQQQPIV
jgi:hypothetical protein